MSRADGVLGGLRASVPIALGYFPVAVSFGVVAARAGLSLLEAALLSLVVFAGASQFVAVALVAGGAGPLVTFLSLLAMNVRHVFYGPSLTGRLGGRPVPGRPWLWGSFLTDEVFAASVAAVDRDPARVGDRWLLGLGLGAYLAWAGGTFVGVLGGSASARFPAVDAALGFMLTALFLTLLLALVDTARLGVAVVAGVVCLTGSLLSTTATGIPAGMVAGALYGASRARPGLAGAP